jgi:hypothetical protein
VRIDCGDAQHVNKAHPSLKSSSGCQTQASGYKILDTMTAWTSASSFKQLSAPVQDSSTADASVPFPSLLIEPHWDGLARINIWKAMRESYSVESELQLSEDSLLWQDPRQETLQLIKENCQDRRNRRWTVASVLPKGILRSSGSRNNLRMLRQMLPAFLRYGTRSQR